MTQRKQHAWTDQWSRFRNDTPFLFEDWIYPNTMETFYGKRVLDAGCGDGSHALRVARLAAEVVAVDLNTIPRVGFGMFEFFNCDIAIVSFWRPFDVVYSIGVIHHTDDPYQTFRNLYLNTKPGGRLIIWVYSREGNLLNRFLLEPIKALVLRHLPADMLYGMAWSLTALLYLPVWTLYLLPLRWLPFHDYFGNFRKLHFRRNLLNIFDKLIAPQTIFLSEDEMRLWFNTGQFKDIHISQYKGVSWRCSGTKR